MLGSQWKLIAMQTFLLCSNQIKIKTCMLNPNECKRKFLVWSTKRTTCSAPRFHAYEHVRRIRRIHRRLKDDVSVSRRQWTDKPVHDKLWLWHRSVFGFSEEIITKHRGTPLVGDLGCKYLPLIHLPSTYWRALLWEHVWQVGAEV